VRERITVVGGGLAGLTAAIACAESGLDVTLYEAHHALGGRARSTAAPYIANDGPHVFYADGQPFRWLAARGLVQPFTGPTARELLRIRFRDGDRLRVCLPWPALRTFARRRLRAPVDEDFATWGARQFGATGARMAAAIVGVVTYTADTGRLSAAFVWDRVLRATRPGYPSIRYVAGGWGTVVERMARHAESLGVRLETGARVDVLPEPPVIVATGLDTARGLLGDERLRWDSGCAALFDLGLRRDRRDVFVVSDLDEGGFLGQYSRSDPSLAPAGHSLVQIQMPVRNGEPRAGAMSRAERLADLGLPGWRERVTWRRQTLANRRTGAVDPPRSTWRDRPAVDRGDGIWLVGDSVAAPGVLSEVSVNSALEAARSLTARRPAPR
jgi:phytoene dehydrogenase-like protein